MNTIRKLAHLFNLAMVLLLLTNCSVVAPSTRHDPRSAQESKLSLREAHDILTQSVRHIHKLEVARPTYELAGHVVVEVTVRKRDLDVRGRFTDGGGGTVAIQIPLASPSINYYEYTRYTEEIMVRISDSTHTIVNFMCASREEALRFVDALAAMRDYTARGMVIHQGDGMNFAQVVERYHQAHPKPRLPEEVRKFQVQAEHAVQQKRYDEAVTLYAEALQLAPWWSEGYFNRALLLGDSDRSDEAIDEMKKYLALEPEAKDARAAQDKIYQWDSDAQRVSSEGNIRVRIEGRAKD